MFAIIDARIRIGDTMNWIVDVAVKFAEIIHAKKK